jgi:hypothetical protein
MWITGSYLFIKRARQLGKLPPRGIHQLWRYYLPLAVDLCLASIAWIIVPRQFRTPLETIRLFSPDIFLAFVLMTILGASWSLARTFLTFHSHSMKVQESTAIDQANA